MRWIRRAVLAAMLALAAMAARAQPAGRPGMLQVQSPPLVIHHDPEQAALAEQLAARGPIEVARISLTLGIPVPPRIDVYIVPTRAGDPSVLGLPAAPDWAAGYALVDRPEIVLRTTDTHGPTGNDAETVFTHELVHSLVSAAIGPQRHADLPAWFVEGLASHLAYEWRLVHSAHVAGLALSGPYVPLRQIEERFPVDSGRAQLAYLESFAFLGWLTRESGEDALRVLLQRFRAGESFDDAFREAFGAPWSVLEDRWEAGFLLRYRWLPIITSSATLWALVAVMFVAGGVMKRRRMKQTLLKWEEEERLLWPDELPWIAPPPDEGEAPEEAPAPAVAAEPLPPEGTEEPRR